MHKSPLNPLYCKYLYGHAMLFVDKDQSCISLLPSSSIDYSPAKRYARLNRVTEHSLVIDHAPCITTRSTIRIGESSDTT